MGNKHYAGGKSRIHRVSHLIYSGRITLVYVYFDLCRRNLQMLFAEFCLKKLPPREARPPLARPAVGAQLGVEHAVHETGANLATNLGQVAAKLIRLANGPE